MKLLAYRRSWLLWLGLFLVLELTAAVNSSPGDTLSENVWRWFPGLWWLLIAGLLISLVAHFSPKHTSVRPVIGFGALVGARIAWVQWRAWPFVAVAGLALAWWLLWPGEHLCVPGDVDQPCRHRTRLGALIDRYGFRVPARLP